MQIKTREAFPNLRKCQGFTLIELMITLAVLAIVATITVPSFMAQIKKNQLYSDMREIVDGGMETRSEAILRRTNKKMVLSGTDATAYKVWVPTHSKSLENITPIEYSLLGFLVGDTQCIEITHKKDDSITLAITFDKDGSVLSGKDKTSCS